MRPSGQKSDCILLVKTVTGWLEFALRLEQGVRVMSPMYHSILLERLYAAAVTCVALQAAFAGFGRGEQNQVCRFVWQGDSRLGQDSQGASGHCSLSRMVPFLEMGQGAPKTACLIFAPVLIICSLYYHPI